jgi:hypothetical protein
MSTYRAIVPSNMLRDLFTSFIIAFAAVAGAELFSRIWELF